MNALNQIYEISKHSENLSFKLIADFLIKNINNLDDYTIFDIASKTSTSPSTVTRFCKKLGLTGYKGLSTILNQQNLFKKMSLNVSEIEDFNFDSSNIQFVDDLLSVTSKSLEKTSEINKNAIIRTKNLIESSNNIFIYARGGNSFLAYLFVDWSIRINKKAFFSSDIDQQEAYAKIIENGDCALIISYSLKNEFYSSIFEKLSKKNIKKIIITKNILSELIGPTDIVLEIGENESIIENRFSSEIASLFLLKLIFHGLLDKDKIEKFKQTDNNF